MASNDEQGAAAPRAFSALLRVRQGSSERSTWLLSEEAGGNMISVGADPACDWQVRAAFVPARAFSLLVVGGRAFVRSGPEPGLLIDGKPVDDGWNPLSETNRIDIGLARLEVRTGYADALADEPVVELNKARLDGMRAWAQRAIARDERQDAYEQATAQTAVVQRAVVHSTPTQRPTQRGVRGPFETQEYRWPEATSGQVQVVTDEPSGVGRRPAQPELRTRPANQRAAGKVRNSTIELDLDDLDYAGTLPHHARLGESAVQPSLLECDEVTRVTGGSRGMRYVVSGVLFAGAYGAWLYLLDRI